MKKRRWHETTKAWKLRTRPNRKVRGDRLKERNRILYGKIGQVFLNRVMKPYRIAEFLRTARSVENPLAGVA